MGRGTWVGLDVHARKVVAGVLDAGELRSWRAPAVIAETVAWLQQYPAPVRVAYEAGLTGYGLAPLLQLALDLMLLLASQTRQARLEELVPPAVLQRLRDPMLPADIADRAVALQPGQHDLQFLLGQLRYLRCSLNPVLPSWLSGPSCEARRTRSSLRLDPTGLASAPTARPTNLNQASVYALPGSRPARSRPAGS